MPVSPAHLALLVVAAFAAGTIDAIGGGGGLVTVPALLAAGLPPSLALGTNKGQAVFGSGAALLRYARAGLVDGRVARAAFPAGFAGSLGGAALVLLVPPARLDAIEVVGSVTKGEVRSWTVNPGMRPALLFGISSACVASVDAAHQTEVRIPAM